MEPKGKSAKYSINHQIYKYSGRTIQYSMMQKEMLFLSGLSNNSLETTVKCTTDLIFFFDVNFTK